MKRKKTNHPTAGDFYEYVFGRTFNGGAEEFVFEPKFTLPLYSFRGAGRLAGAMNILGPTPLNIITQRATITGYGTQAGVFALQPLLGDDGGEG